MLQYYYPEDITDTDEFTPDDVSEQNKLLEELSYKFIKEQHIFTYKKLSIQNN